MRVTAVVDGLALCDGSEVLIELVGDVAAGDELLVHAGVALVKL
jgi:hydrogenase maturation factor